MGRSSGFGSVVAACAAITLGVSFWGCGDALGRRPLIVAFDGVPATLDPHWHNESVVWSVLSNFFDALVGTTPDMRLEPALAVAWRQASPTEWRLELREGVRFSDGSAFTAADVVASFRRAATHPNSGIRHLLTGVEDLRSVGDHEVAITTRAPSPDLLNRLAFLFVVPSAAAAAEEITIPVGTGPYRFVEREPDGSVSARGWRSWRGSPAIERMRMEFYPTARGVALSRFLAGAVDVLAVVEDDDLTRIESRPGVRLEPQPRLAVNLLAIASRAAPGDAGRALADPRVRRALLLALNRQAWVGRVYRGNATVASQYVHPVVVGYDPSVQALPYDPEGARRLLAEAGFASGFDVQFGHGPGLPSIVAAIREDLARVSVRVHPHEAPFSDLIRLARTGEVALFYYAWACSTGDASDFLNSSLHTRDEALGLGAENFTGYSDPEVDAVLAAAESELVPARRLELLQRSQRRALEALPVLPLTVRWSYVGVSDRVDIVTRHDRRLWVAGWRWRR
jgi:peptide/nickel transport system substrate-binding protein